MSEKESSPDLKVSREALQLVHHHPGRLRVRADRFRVDETAIERVQAGMGELRGVLRFEHNTRTGSILVEYEPGVANPEAILAFIADAADLDRYSPPLAQPAQPGLVAIDAAREANAIAYELTGKKVDLRVLVPAGLAGLAAYAFFEQKGDRLPRWDNLVWWSQQLFVQFHRREVDQTDREPAATPPTPTPSVVPPASARPRRP